MPTSQVPTSQSPTPEDGTEPAPSDPRVTEPIRPILSSPLDDGEFEVGAYPLFSAQRILDTDDLRARFVGLAGGPASRLDDVDLDAQFILVATTGQCSIPTTPPTLVIGPDDAAVIDVAVDDANEECYRPLTVVHFFAVDTEFRDRFPLALADLDGVIDSHETLTADEVTPELLDRLTEPTFVEGDADYAALAPEVTDEDSRGRVTSFAHQAKLLVPVRACIPAEVTVRIRLFAEATVETIDPDERDCDTAERYIAVFSLSDSALDQLRSTAPATWNASLAGESVIVTPSGPQSVFVGEAADGDRFDELTSHRISTSEALAASTLEADFDAPLADVDLGTRFLVVVVRRDCSVLTDGNGIIIGGDSWEVSPPIPDTLDCDLPNVSIMGYVVDRQYLDLFDDLPEGQP